MKKEKNINYTNLTTIITAFQQRGCRNVLGLTNDLNIRICFGLPLSSKDLFSTPPCIEILTKSRACWRNPSLIEHVFRGVAILTMHDQLMVGEAI